MSSPRSGQGNFGRSFRDPPELVGDVTGRLRSRVGIFGKALLHDGQILLRRGGVGGIRDVDSVEELRQAEIEKLHAGAREHDVCGLQVAVHDPRAVRSVETVPDLHPVLERLLQWQRAFLQPFRERLTLDVLHHEERDAVLFSDVVECKRWDG